MLGFNQDEYLTSAREIIAARKQAEAVADDIYQSGYSALFFASIGGSLAPMMAILLGAFQKIIAKPHLIKTPARARLYCFKLQVQWLPNTYRYSVSS